METIKFQNLIQAITGKDLKINTNDTEIVNGKEYTIYRTLPLTERNISFAWKAAITNEKLLRSFITAYTTKYREPNPRAYDYMAKVYGESARWENKTELEKEYAYSHHSSNMYGKQELMKQIEENFKSDTMYNTMILYGFYATEYGVGIFSLFEFDSVIKAIKQMKEYLNAKCIPYKNEYSDARWVYRFKLNLTKEAHEALLHNFAQQIKNNSTA